jgi:hypothetical protein
MLQKAYAEGLRALVLFTASQQDTVDQARLTRPVRGVREGLGRRPRQPDQRPAAADRQGPGLRARLGAARHRVAADLRRVRASCRTTRSSSTSATPRSTPSTRARRRSRAWTSSSARSSSDQGQALTACPRRSRSSPRTSAPTTAASTADRELLGKGLEDVQGIVGFMVGELMKSDPRTGGDLTNLYKVGQNTTRCCWPPATSSSAGCCCARPRWPWTPSSRRRRPQGQGLLHRQGRGGAVLRPQVLPRLSAERAMAEATDSMLMDVPESAF